MRNLQKTLRTAIVQASPVVISKIVDGIKILGNGNLEKSLTVKGCKLSKTAIEKIEAAGGKVEVI